MTPNHLYPLKFTSTKQKIHVSCKKPYKQTRKQEKMTSYRGKENGSRIGGKEGGRKGRREGVERKGGREGGKGLLFLFLRQRSQQMTLDRTLIMSSPTF